MSYINLPDPDPGRCMNTRSVPRGDGSYETLRCLDYEGVAHVCTFPHPVTTGREQTWAASSKTVYTVPKPKPWVKPKPWGE